MVICTPLIFVVSTVRNLVKALEGEMTHPENSVIPQIFLVNLSCRRSFKLLKFDLI